MWVSGLELSKWRFWALHWYVTAVWYFHMCFGNCPRLWKIKSFRLSWYLCWNERDTCQLSYIMSYCSLIYFWKYQLIDIIISSSKRQNGVVICFSIPSQPRHSNLFYAFLTDTSTLLINQNYICWLTWNSFRNSLDVIVYPVILSQQHTLLVSCFEY